MTLLVTTKHELQAELARRDGRAVALVPTMGALHEGHISLVRRALELADTAVVSIFVNPTQFGPGSDYDRYPRTLEADLAVLELAGAHVVFAPDVDEMYPDGFVTSIDPGPLASRWEGASRPGHFNGVATVVTKLLALARPDIAIFGEKDYQQLQIIRRVATDLDLRTEIVGGATVRADDGLALSSRNAYLTAEQRADALVLARSLERAAQIAATGGTADEAEAAMREEFVRVSNRVDLDYAAIVDCATLEPTCESTGYARAIVAARVGTTRLIDNCEVRFGA